MVALRGPQGRLVKLVQQLVRRGELSCPLQVRIDRDRLDVFRIELHVGLHFRVLEAEDSKGGLVLVEAFAAGVLDLLQRRGLLLGGKLDVLLCEIAVLVQHFPEAPDHPLAEVRIHLELHVSCHVLPEVQDLLPVRGRRDDRMKMFMLSDGDVVGSSRYNLMARLLRMPGIHGRAEGFHDLAVLLVRETDRAVVGPLPCLIRDDRLFRAVLICDLQLHEKLRLCAVLVFDAPGAAGTAVPAISELGGEFILAHLQHVRHVVGLILDAPLIIRVARREAEIADLFAVQFRFVEPAGRRVEARGSDRLRDRHFRPEAVHGIAFIPVHGVVACDPCRFPVGGFQKPHFKEGFAPFTGLALLVPEADLPVHTLAAFERFRVLRVHEVRLHLAAVPFFSDDLVGGLFHAALRVPGEARLPDVDTQRIIKVFGFQSDGFHHHSSWSHHFPAS